MSSSPRDRRVLVVLGEASFESVRTDGGRVDARVLIAVSPTDGFRAPGELASAAFATRWRLCSPALARVIRLAARSSGERWPVEPVAVVAQRPRVSR